MITKQDILEEFNEEAVSTRKILERVPFDKFDFKASPKSMSLGTLALIVGTMPGWFLSMVNKSELEMGSYQQPPKPTNVEDLLKEFDKEVAQVQEALAAMDDATLADAWALKMGGKVLMEAPRRVMLRQTINHWVHHRAQLGVDLKINGVAHPAIYGASGDEGW